MPKLTKEQTKRMLNRKIDFDFDRTGKKRKAAKAKFDKERADTAKVIADFKKKLAAAKKLQARFIAAKKKFDASQTKKKSK
jgi:hypothetical protein